MKPAGDFTARLTMPFFCPILPNTPAAGIDHPAGSGPYYFAERITNQRTVLERNPFYRGDRPANVDQIVWTPGASLDACLEAIEDGRADLCGEPGAPRTAYRALAERYGLNRPGGRLFIRPALGAWFIAFNHDRPAFKGSGQIPLKKAINYAIDRPELTRAFGGLAGRRTDQMLPPAFARPASIYPLDGADPVAARRWYGRARLRPTKLVLYAWTIPPAVIAAQVIVYNLARLGIEVEVKYFSALTAVTKARTPGEPFDLVLSGYAPDYADGAAYFEPLLGRGGAANFVNVDDPGLRRRMKAASLLTGDARAERLGRPGRRPHAGQPAVGAHHAHQRPRLGLTEPRLFRRAPPLPRRSRRSVQEVTVNRLPLWLVTLAAGMALLVGASGGAVGRRCR